MMNQKNFLRRILALALAAALCLALAGCGGAPASSGGTDAPASSGSDASGSDASGSDASGTGTSGADGSGAQGDQMSEGQRYAFAIRDARPAEENEYFEVVSGDAGAAPFFAVNPNSLSEEDMNGMISMMMETMGLKADTLDAYAFSMSMMNVNAYAIGVFKPAEGKEQEVRTALEEYISLQQKAFEQYLEDQYKIAKGAYLETLPGGELVLVMTENAADVLEALRKAL